MEDKVFHLPIGFQLDGQEILELPIAETGGEAEKIYTKKPGASKLHTWFAQVLAASIESIGGKRIASEFHKSTDKEIIPEVIKQIPFIDCGSLLLQIQRECWEPMIREQRITCTNCGAKLTADIDLTKIEIPVNETGKSIKDFVVKLHGAHTIQTGISQLEAYEGVQFNAIRFRTATLGDGMKHEKIVKDQILFWQKIAFDTLKEFLWIDEEGNEEIVADGFHSKRAMLLFSKDLSTKNLKAVRSGVQTTLPSAKYFYEEPCFECSEDTPFFATVSNFFSV